MSEMKINDEGIHCTLEKSVNIRQFHCHTVASIISVFLRNLHICLECLQHMEQSCANEYVHSYGSTISVILRNFRICLKCLRYVEKSCIRLLVQFSYSYEIYIFAQNVYGTWNKRANKCEQVCTRKLCFQDYHIFLFFILGHLRSY